jgi:hypothetical protein
MLIPILKWLSEQNLCTDYWHVTVFGETEVPGQLGGYAGGGSYYDNYLHFDYISHFPLKSQIKLPYKKTVSVGSFVKASYLSKTRLESSIKKDFENYLKLHSSIQKNYETSYDVTSYFERHYEKSINLGAMDMVYVLSVIKGIENVSAIDASEQIKGVNDMELLFKLSLLKKIENIKKLGNLNSVKGVNHVDIIDKVERL